jgi:hypothetical protein
MSLAGIIPRWFGVFQDRGRLRIDFSIESRRTAPIVVFNSKPMEEKTYLIVTATNIGRRPVKVSRFLIDDGKGERDAETEYHLFKPTTINENESEEWRLNPDRSIKRVILIDAKGNRWKSRIPWKRLADPPTP